jgi:REP element-mobilizing transposase RayT
VPRQARLDAPGTLHHVIVRGIEKRRIVDDEKDRESFVSRLGDLAAETQTKIYAWSLMTNHAHLLLRSGPPGLPKLMRRLLTGYAVVYNSIVCDEDHYFRELVRYIHLNPLRAHLVRSLLELDDYRWCGHGVLVGRIKHSWQDRDYVLAWFGKREGEARRTYRQYVQEGISQGRRPELVGGGMVRSFGGWSAVLSLRRSQGQLVADQRILGAGDFVERVLRDSEEQNRFSITLRERRREMEAIVAAACGKAGINVQELRMGSRRGVVPRIRSEVGGRLVQEFGMPLAEVARALGVSTSAISKILRRRN